MTATESSGDHARGAEILSRGLRTRSAPSRSVPMATSPWSKAATATSRNVAIAPGATYLVAGTMRSEGPAASRSVSRIGDTSARSETMATMRATSSWLATKSQSARPLDRTLRWSEMSRSSVTTAHAPPRPAPGSGSDGVRSFASDDVDDRLSCASRGSPSPPRRRPRDPRDAEETRSSRGSPSPGPGDARRPRPRDVQDRDDTCSSRGSPSWRPACLGPRRWTSRTSTSVASAKLSAWCGSSVPWSLRMSTASQVSRGNRSKAARETTVSTTWRRLRRRSGPRRPRPSATICSSRSRIGSGAAMVSWDPGGATSSR
mmetsp:Transcript_8353/g.28646  ORF Transcript_8353/g.28646 Transcript_8353/m.28646 type:complete len:317 (+) Transcript_8353:179-1129(+)